MYRILLERAAEKDLARLSTEIHDRVIAQSASLPQIHAPPVVENWQEANMTGVSVLETIG
jgi:hypothetical protein